MSTTGESREALIALGSNLGDRQATLAGAARMLRTNAAVSNLVASSIYETAPVGMVDQPLFLNAVVAVSTRATPEELLRLLLGIEQQYGRERQERWGPRTLDLDLLAYEKEQRATVELTLPHPRMFERTFVTVPLNELLRRPEYAAASRWSDLLAAVNQSGPVAGVTRFAAAESWS